jgi:DNA-directed RNA polymerases I and III subunit RPAC2
MHFRIQAHKNVRAIDVLRRGLEDLDKVCDHTIETFDLALKNYRNN